MEPIIVQVARANGGYLHREDLLALGETDRAVSQAVRAGFLRRIRVGTYVVRSMFDVLRPEDRHAVLARSVIDKLPSGSVALSHGSAAVLHGLSVFDIDLGTVHLTRLDGGAGRTESGVHHHVGALEPEEVVEIDGRLVVAPARAVWETACGTTRRGALVVLDSGLHHGVLAPDDLHDVADRFRSWRGARSARLMARVADAGSENVGETLLRYLAFVAGLPAPVTQFEIVDGGGRVIARTDLGWPDLMHVAELDGRRKYWRDLRPGEDASDVVVREKLREDAIRALRYGVTRASFADVVEPGAARTIERLRIDLERAAATTRPRRRIIA